MSNRLTLQPYRKNSINEPDHSELPEAKTPNQTNNSNKIFQKYFAILAQWDKEKILY